MRRLPFVLALGTMLAFGCGAALALDLEIVNQSRTTIQHLYLSAAGERAWGDDQLGEGEDDTIDPGDSYTVTDIEPGRYDLKLVARDGTTCIISDQRFGTDKVWTVTEAMLDTCGQ